MTAKVEVILDDECVSIKVTNNYSYPVSIFKTEYYTIDVDYGYANIAKQIHDALLDMGVDVEGPVDMREDSLDPPELPELDV